MCYDLIHWNDIDQLLLFRDSRQYVNVSTRKILDGIRVTEEVLRELGSLDGIYVEIETSDPLADPLMVERGQILFSNETTGRDLNWSAIEEQDTIAILPNDRGVT